MSLTIKPYTRLNARTYQLGRILVDKACTIEGRGIDVTVVEMTESVLFDIVMNDDKHVTIKDLTIKVTDRVVDSAIRYDGSGQVAHYPDVSLVADRTTPRLLLQNVNIEAKGSGVFRKAVNLKNALGVTMFNCSFNQSHNNRNGIAIYIDGFYQPVEFNILSTRIMNFNTGIKSVEAEGVKVMMCNIVANTVGVQAANINSQPEINISDNHISSDLHNLHLTKVDNASIEGNTFFKRENNLARHESSSLFMSECRNSIIVGNIFTEGNWNHIHTRNCENITIGANNHSNELRKVYDDSIHYAL